MPQENDVTMIKTAIASRDRAELARKVRAELQEDRQSQACVFVQYLQVHTVIHARSETFSMLRTARAAARGSAQKRRRSDPRGARADDAARTGRGDQERAERVELVVRERRYRADERAGHEPARAPTCDA